MKNGDYVVSKSTPEIGVMKVVNVTDDPKHPELTSIVTVDTSYGLDDGDRDDLVVVERFKVTGVIPTPMSNPRRPYFDHTDDTAPSGKPVQVGEAGHTVSVETQSFTVAEQLAEIFAKVYEDVRIDPVLT